MYVNRSTSTVDPSRLAGLRDLVAKEKGSKPLLEAIDQCAVSHSVAREIQKAGQRAHERPRQARSEHHALVRAAVAEGREPDDHEAWFEVEAADADLLRHQARHAAAEAGTKVSTAALIKALDAAWPVLFPVLAQRRLRELASSGLTPETEWLYASTFRWPRLLGPAPGIEKSLPLPTDRGPLPADARTTEVSRWWPIALHPNSMSRREHQEWTEWAWERLAAGHFDVVEPDALAFTATFQTTVRPSTMGSHSEMVARALPVVTVTHEGVVLR